MLGYSWFKLRLAPLNFSKFMYEIALAIGEELGSEGKRNET